MAFIEVNFRPAAAPEFEHHWPLVADQRELGCNVGSACALKVRMHLVHAQQPPCCLQVLLAIQAAPQHLGRIKDKLDTRTDSWKQQQK